MFLRLYVVHRNYGISIVIQNKQSSEPDIVGGKLQERTGQWGWMACFRRGPDSGDGWHALGEDRIVAMDGKLQERTGQWGCVACFRRGPDSGDGWHALGKDRIVGMGGMLKERTGQWRWVVNFRRGQESGGSKF